MPTHKHLERREKTSTRQVGAINRYRRAKNRKIHKHTHVLALSACLQPWPVSRTRSPVISTYTGCEAYCYWQSHHSCRHHTLIASHFTLLSLFQSSQLFFSFFHHPLIRQHCFPSDHRNRAFQPTLWAFPEIPSSNFLFQEYPASPETLQGSLISQISTLKSCSSVWWMIRQWHPSFYRR